MRLILTVPHDANIDYLANESSVDSVRLNTTLPVDAPLEQIISRMRDDIDPKKLWVDLKGRQLRVAKYTIDIQYDQEVHYVDLNHKIKVDLPTGLWIDDGNFIGKVTNLQNGGKRLVVPSAVIKKVGLPLAVQGDVGIRPSMSVNIPDPSLEILTRNYTIPRDKKYVKASKKVGVHNFMLSYFQKQTDISEVFKLDQDANIALKVEDQKGLNFLKKNYKALKKKYGDRINIVAARGDGYIELDRPDQIIDFCEDIIKIEPNAIFASRLLSSLKNVDNMPACNDLFDLYSGMQMGYKNFMIGDDICRSEDSLRTSIGLFEVMAKKYERYHKK